MYERFYVKQLNLFYFSLISKTESTVFRKYVVFQGFRVQAQHVIKIIISYQMRMEIIIFN